jgi:hypothetical protein
MSKAIRHALMIANSTIERPAPLEINHKIPMMGGGAILIVSKNRPLFVQRLSVFLFFRELRKIRPPARKNLEENSGPDPLVVTLWDSGSLHCFVSDVLFYSFSICCFYFVLLAHSCFAFVLHPWSLLRYWFWGVSLKRGLKG